WTGEQFDFDGQFNTLRGACVTPAPQSAPRVVVGVAKSRLLATSAVAYADELNLYADDDVIAAARELVAASGRSVDLSLFFDWSWDGWPADAASQLAHWRDAGIDRVFVSLGAADMPARLRELEPLLSA